MSDEEKRTATDVLLAIEQKVELLVKLFANNDLNQKLLLDRLNRMVKVMESPPEGEEDSDEHLESNEPDFNFQIEDKPKGLRRTSRNKKADEGTLVQVFQKVVTEDKKPVFMAEVEVVNENGSLVHKARTMNGGKWIASLPPGDYVCRIVKKENAQNKRMEYNEKIIVDFQEKPLELPLAVVK